MAPLLAGKDAVAGTARASEHARHRPEQTRLYQLVEQYYPAFVEHLAARERTLHVHVRVRCVDCHAERLVAFSWPLLRIPAPAVFVIPFTSQATRLLPELLCAPDG